MVPPRPIRRYASRLRASFGFFFNSCAGGGASTAGQCGAGFGFDLGFVGVRGAAGDDDLGGAEGVAVLTAAWAMVGGAAAALALAVVSAGTEISFTAAPAAVALFRAITWSIAFTLPSRL